jgi:hypothetical protein
MGKLCHFIFSLLKRLSLPPPLKNLVDRVFHISL